MTPADKLRADLTCTPEDAERLRKLWLATPLGQAIAKRYPAREPNLKCTALSGGTYHYGTCEYP